MDHSHMDHGGMDHGDMGPMCNMNMLFTWSTQDLCIVFKWWHIQTTAGLIFSLLAVVAVTALYEAIRASSRKFERAIAKRNEETPNENPTERSPFLWLGRNQVKTNNKAHTIKALLYAVQTFYAFMLMLLFMTYNGWVMLAVGVGAFVGYLLFGNDNSATRDGACH